MLHRLIKLMRGTLAGAICNIGNFTVSLASSQSETTQAIFDSGRNKLLCFVLEIAMLIDMNAG